MYGYIFSNWTATEQLSSSRIKIKNVAFFFDEMKKNIIPMIRLCAVVFIILL